MSNDTDRLEHPKGSGIFIREKINTSGTEAYGSSFAVTVPVKVTGKARIRKQFKTLDEAKEYAQKQYDGKEVQGKAFFDATDQERREFGEVLPMLRTAGISLRDAVHFAVSSDETTISMKVRELQGDKSPSPCTRILT